MCCDYRPWESNVQKQIQIQIQNKQTIAQKKARYNINLTLRELLYYLETIAYREGQFQRKFDFFKPNSIQGKENMDQLINHLRVKSKAFHLLYEEYCEEYGNYFSHVGTFYLFEIVKSIFYWKKFVHSKYQIYYDNILYILRRKDNVFYPGERKVNKVAIDIEKNNAYFEPKRELFKEKYVENRCFDIDLEWERILKKLKREQDYDMLDDDCAFDYF